MDVTLFQVGGDPTTVLELAMAMVSAGAVLLLAWGAARLVRYRLTLLDEGDRLTASRIAFYIISVFGLMGCLDSLGLGVGRPLFSGVGLTFSVLTMATFAALLAVVLFGTNLVRKLAERRLLLRLEPGARYAVARILYYVLLTVGLLAALQTLGLELSSLTVALGALSVGIGFGLQNVVNNFVSGLILLFERPIQVGDWIQVEGTSGRITQIGARSIKVVTNDNITILVPNATLLSSQVINWSHGDSRVRVRIPIGVAYDSDLEQVVRVLVGVAEETDKVLREPKPTVLLENFGDWAVNLELAVWIDIRATAVRRLRSDLNFRIHAAFREHGIEIPYPRTDLILLPDGQEGQEGDRPRKDLRSTLPSR